MVLPETEREADDGFQFSSHRSSLMLQWRFLEGLLQF